MYQNLFYFVLILASRYLVEYEIQKEALQISSFQNISRAELKFVFRRRMEFHVTNTFLQVKQFTTYKIYVKLVFSHFLIIFFQTSILVLMGYLSYFFDVENFAPRIKVVLTTMLVIATITTSIKAVSKYFLAHKYSRVPFQSCLKIILLKNKSYKWDRI